MARLKAELDLEKLPLNPDERHNVEKVVEDYADVFSVSGSSLGKTDVVYHRIDTGDSAPIRQHPRRLSPNHREEVENFIQDMLEKGVVQPPHSTWASSIVLVQKKDGSIRMCVDRSPSPGAFLFRIRPLPQHSRRWCQRKQINYYADQSTCA